MALPTPRELHRKIVADLNAKARISEAVRRRSDRHADPARDASGEWTNVLLNILIDLGDAAGFTSYPRRLYFRRKHGGGRNSKHDRPLRPDDRGEYLFDACWTTYPKTENEWLSQLMAGPVPAPRIHLACECEWVSLVRGRPTPPEHVVAIRNDFAKLVDVPATVRVMLFALLDEDGARLDEIVRLCMAAASAAPHDDPRAGYLLLGWPWNARWDQRTSSLRSAYLTDRDATSGSR